MESEYGCKVDERASLKTELDCAVARWKEADSAYRKMESENKALREEIAELKSNIKFLEGQIEAFQYCMNCRR